MTSAFQMAVRAQHSTPDQIARSSAANCDAIEQVLSQLGVTEVLGAWGNMGGSATLKRALPDVRDLLSGLGVRAYTLDALLKTGNPAHPHPPGRPLPMLGPKRYLA